jgi:glutathione-specific gamma-glutamylcyclotransferase
MDLHLRDDVRSKMALTAELVKLCERPEPDLGPDPNFTPIEPSDRDALTEKLLEELGNKKLWIFAYGSLIWKPTFSIVAQRRGTIHGWHRSFCLELTRWRGTPQLPGLMLALDHGGRCDGVAYQLPDGEHREHIRRLIGREISAIEDLKMVRWVTVHTASGPLSALVFWAGPKGKGIALKLPLERVAWVLARACGHGGSCASYLYNTVLHLEELGIHDQNLWKLQELVAHEILTSNLARLGSASTISGCVNYSDFRLALGSFQMWSRSCSTVMPSSE